MPCRQSREDVSRIILTASGGPFRTASAERSRGDAGPGGRPSQLVDGRQDLGQFGDDDEQGPRADRGALPVRPSVGADRRRHPSAVGGSFAGRIRRRVGARAARRARTCGFRSLMRWPGPSGWRRRRSGSTLPRSPGSISKRRTSSDFPALRLAREALEAGGRRRSSSMPPTKSRSPASLRAASAFPKSPSSVERGA